MKTTKPPTLKVLEAQAQTLAHTYGVHIEAARDKVAKSNGFNTWASLVAARNGVTA